MPTTCAARSAIARACAGFTAFGGGAPMPVAYTSPDVQLIMPWPTVSTASDGFTLLGRGHCGLVQNKMDREQEHRRLLHGVTPIDFSRREALQSAQKCVISLHHKIPNISISSFYLHLARGTLLVPADTDTSILSA